MWAPKDSWASSPKLSCAWCARLKAPALEDDQALFTSGPLTQTGRIMVKDENICLHCGLCAERCPTYAWDMRKFVLQQPMAGVTFIPLEAVVR